MRAPAKKTSGSGPAPVAQRRPARGTPDKRRIAELLATYPSNLDAWNSDHHFEISTFRTKTVFFCPTLDQLAGRASTVAELCETHLPRFKGRRYITDLAHGRPATLDKVLNVDEMLTAIAKSEIQDLLEATADDYSDGSSQPLTLTENNVVPSHLWVDHTLLAQFRIHARLTPAVLGNLLFGDQRSAAAIIGLLEAGEMRSPNGKKDKKKKPPRRYDFRVTPFTADVMYRGMQRIFEVGNLAGDSFPVFPSDQQFFVASSTAGPAGGHCTHPLRIRQGNLMRPFNAVQVEAMEQRIVQHFSGPKQPA